MKNIILTTLILSLFSTFSYSQLDFNINLGLGLTTSQFIKERPTENQTISGMLSPILGIYTEAKLNNFITELGIESSSVKSRAISNYRYETTQNIINSRSEINRLSIPLSLGYELNVYNIAITPKIGIIRHIKTTYNNSSTNIYIEGDHISTEKYHYKGSDGVYGLGVIQKTQIMGAIDIKLSKKFSLGTTIIIGKNRNNPYMCCFGDCYSYYHNGNKDFNKDYRLVFKYQL